MFRLLFANLKHGQRLPLVLQRHLRILLAVEWSWLAVTVRERITATISAVLRTIIAGEVLLLLLLMMRRSAVLLESTVVLIAIVVLSEFALLAESAEHRRLIVGVVPGVHDVLCFLLSTENRRYMLRKSNL